MIKKIPMVKNRQEELIDVIDTIEILTRGYLNTKKEIKEKEAKEFIKHINNICKKVEKDYGKHRNTKSNKR